MSVGGVLPERRGVIVRYYAYRATSSAGLYLPVSILYLRDQGFGLAFIGLTQATFAAAKLAAEVPTGYLGDALGRRESLAVASGLRVAAMVGYALAASAPAFLAVQVVWATGFAFRSGTQDAWLYEVLRARCDADEFARVEGRGSTVLLVTSAAGALASGLLYAVAPELPYVANAALAALGLPILYSFPDPAGGPNGASGAGEGRADGRLTVRGALRVLGLQAGRPDVRWLVVYAALFGGLFSVTRWLEQPALDAVGVPVAGFGVVYAGFKLVSAGAAATSGWFDDRLGARRTFALLVPVTAVAYAGVALAPALVLPALFVNRGRRVVTRPIRNAYLNDRLEDVGRATVLSGVSMVLSLAGVAANLAGGVLAAAAGPLALLPAAGVAVAAAAGLVWTLADPVRTGDGRADPAGATGATAD